MEMAIDKKSELVNTSCCATEGPSQKFLVVGHPTDLFWGNFSEKNN
jgi:hypothetical protein